jgi:hypothetical protein
VAVTEVTLDDINQGIEAFVDPATLFIAPPHFFPALLRFLLDPAFGLAPLFLDYPAQPQNETACFGNLSRVLPEPVAELSYRSRGSVATGLMARRNDLIGRIILSSFCATRSHRSREVLQEPPYGRSH